MAQARGQERAAWEELTVVGPFLLARMPYIPVADSEVRVALGPSSEVLEDWEDDSPSAATPADEVDPAGTTHGDDDPFLPDARTATADAPTAALQAKVIEKTRERQLSEAEWAALPTLISCRLAMSLTIGMFSAAQDPDNEYLRLTLRPGWRALQLMRGKATHEWSEALRGA